MKDDVGAPERLRVGPLSPVYWAGASLKVLPLLDDEGGAQLSPVYWAGASLKAGG